MVDGGLRLQEFIREHYIEDALSALRRDSLLAMSEKPRPLYFELPTQPRS